MKPTKLKVLYTIELDGRVYTVTNHNTIHDDHNNLLFDGSASAAFDERDLDIHLATLIIKSFYKGFSEGYNRAVLIYKDDETGEQNNI